LTTYIDFYDLAAANGVSVDQDHISAYLAKAFKMGIDCSKEENASACSKLMYNTADFDTCEAVVDEDAAEDAEEDQDQENAQADSESIEEACATFRELEESGNLMNGIFKGTKHAGSYPLTGGAIAGIAVAAIAVAAAIAAVAKYRRKAASGAINSEDLLPDDNKEVGEEFNPYRLENLRTFAIQKHLAHRLNKKKKGNKVSTYEASEAEGIEMGGSRVSC